MMTKKPARNKQSGPNRNLEAPSDSGDLPQRPEMSENVRDSEIPGLSLRQQAVLPVMVNAPSLVEGARLSGVSERTLRRWLEDNAFRAELARRRKESADLACQALQGVLLRSVSVLAESLEDSDAAIRLRAARYAMSFASRIRQLERPPEDVEKLKKEIDELENVISIWPNRRSGK